jgi:hypothetical protein
MTGYIYIKNSITVILLQDQDGKIERTFLSPTEAQIMSTEFSGWNRI